MSNNRRDFLKKAGLLAGGLTLLTPSSFLFADDKEKKAFDFKISLAQWSFHKALFSNKMTSLDFAAKAKNDYGIEAVEYVNQFFKDKAKDMDFLKSLKQRADDNGVRSILIMVDEEGPLASPKKDVRDKAVEKHYKWVDAAKFLGCHAIRVNLKGDASAEDWQKAAVEGLGKLTEYGAKNDINVIVENHGGYSSNGKLLAEVIKQVNNKRCGTLPDFGNFKISPTESYDRYQGTKELMPYAKGVSAKTYDFDLTNGNEITIDYLKIMNIVKDAGYTGYVGIEYEGENMSEEDGVRATLNLLKKVKAELA